MIYAEQRCFYKVPLADGANVPFVARLCFQTETISNDGGAVEEVQQGLQTSLFIKVKHSKRGNHLHDAWALTNKEKLGKEDNNMDNENGVGYDIDGIDPARVVVIEEER